MSDDLERLGQGAWIRRLEAPVGEFRLGLQAPLHDLLGGSPLQHALASPVVGLVEAVEQRLEITMAGDRDAQHLALHPPVEALGQAIGLRRVGLGRAVLQLQRAAGVLEAIRREAGSSVGEHVGDLEGEGADRLLEEVDRASCQFVVLDRQMHPARVAVDGHAGRQSAKYTPQSPNAPDPNNVPLPNS